MAWAYIYYANRGRVEFYLDTWHSDPEKRIEIIQQSFEFLQSHKEEIEKVFGEPLEWHVSRGRVRRIQSSIEGGYENPREEWERICEELVDRMVRLVKCLSPYLPQLP